MNFREYLKEENLEEGKIWDKVRKWLVTNIKPIKKAYIKNESAYAMNRIIVNRPDNKIRLIVAENGYVYMDAYDKNGKNYFLMTDDNIMEDNKDMITGDAPIRLACAKMSDFEYGGMIPYYIYRIYEA